MNKSQLIFNIRMEIAAVRQALRDSDEAALTASQVDALLDRLSYLLGILSALED
ncbi:hypothetical protein [Dyadobacter sp. CY326]|uniref:hypothetical protein n=1 Tax=Dyadobacter sp. CY326 TaxID=2907300 RepID=UPI001F2DF00A|nr:hypothetical protein [Dyadobacter sp. CY326]MCE7065038.1 hypothetical protein [Dyadobacter sp. CY326]